jgi:hypothetical protein
MDRTLRIRFVKYDIVIRETSLFIIIPVLTTGRAKCISYRTVLIARHLCARCYSPAVVIIKQWRDTFSDYIRLAHSQIALRKLLLTFPRYP